jgi:CDP-glycerol glycerophosphotransferase (TagB/SpsB family)
MTLSYYIFKIPYSLFWTIKKKLRKKSVIAYYCDNETDYEIFKNMELENIIYIAKNKATYQFLTTKGLKVNLLPAFPDVVIMARHALHKFPSPKIIKIGLRHGPYHFKQMVNAAKYNAFDLFLMTSEKEVEIAEKMAIISSVSGGYPKLDSFKQAERIKKSKELFQSFHFSLQRKTLLFSSTWDDSGISAVQKWIDKIETLTENFNIMVTLHPKMSKKYVKKLNNNVNIRIVQPDILIECMMMADFLISDTSSIIGEFCTLDKPIITFKIEPDKRLTPTIANMIADISLQIDNFRELEGAIGKYEQNSDLKKTNRNKWNQIMFDDVNISHGKKATEIILSFLQKKGVFYDSRYIKK